MRNRGSWAATLAVALLVGGASPAAAGRASQTLRVAADVGPHVAVQPSRGTVRLEPGQSTTVAVRIKARVARGSLVILTAEAPTAAAGEVFYRGPDRGGRLTGEVAVATVRGSGVHDLSVSLTLAATAPEAAALPLLFRARAEGEPALRMAR
jgi:hypothetical protein